MIDKNAEWNTLELAVKKYGPEAQLKMMLEEMSELQKEICKLWRGWENYTEIADEMADVEIMLDQLKIIFKNAAEVQAHREAKIQRLLDRLRRKAY